MMMMASVLVSSCPSVDLHARPPALLGAGQILDHPSTHSPTLHGVRVRSSPTIRTAALPHRPGFESGHHSRAVGTCRRCTGAGRCAGEDLQILGVGREELEALEAMEALRVPSSKFRIPSSRFQLQVQVPRTSTTRRTKTVSDESTHGV